MDKIKFFLKLKKKVTLINFNNLKTQRKQLFKISNNELL